MTHVIVQAMMRVIGSFDGESRELGVGRSLWSIYPASFVSEHDLA